MALEQSLSEDCLGGNSWVLVWEPTENVWKCIWMHMGMGVGCCYAVFMVGKQLDHAIDGDSSNPVQGTVNKSKWDLWQL